VAAGGSFGMRLSRRVTWPSIVAQLLPASMGTSKLEMQVGRQVAQVLLLTVPHCCIDTCWHPNAMQPP
jgi:hypothetical protein